MKYLKFYKGNIELAESSKYYTQCQIQLYITGLTVCDLYFYSPEGSCLVEVHRNDSFLSSVILISEEFYFKYFLKALYDKKKINFNSAIETISKVNATNENLTLTNNGVKENVPVRTFTGKNIQNIFNSVKNNK